MTATAFTTTQAIVPQAIADTSTTQNNPLGMIIEGYDSALGGAEYIYLLGVVNTAIGSVVTYNPSTFQTALAPVGANKPEPIAVAMSANLAASYGWYQIAGVAVVKKTSATSLAAGVAIGIKTIGLLASTGTGKEVQGALTAAICSSTKPSGKVMINRPHMQGRVT